MTVTDNLRSIIFRKVAIMNEENTEEALISMITDNIMKCSKINGICTDLKDVNIHKNLVKKPNLKSDILNKDIFLYCNNSLYDWTYERCDDIIDAVRKAVKHIDAYIICNGNIISYNTLNDSTAYYCVGNKIKLVELV